MRLRFALILFQCLVGGRAFSQTIAVARKSDITIPVNGTIAFEDKAQLKSPFTGRVETMNAEDQTWVKAGQPLAYLADTKTAALLDSRGMTPKDVLLERWKSIYSLTPVVCLKDCLVVRRFAVEGQRLRPGDPLFKVAYRIALVGRVSPDYSLLIHDGQDLSYWPKSNPLKKFRTVIQNYVVGFSTSSGGQFTSFIMVRRYPEELKWSGLATLAQDVLAVPTDSLVRYQGKVFLPIQVSIGFGNQDITQITAAGPLQNGNPVLVLNGAQLNKASKYDYLKAISRSQNVQILPQKNPSRQPTPQQKNQEGTSFWDQLKNAKSLQSPEQQRKSNSEDDYGN